MKCAGFISNRKRLLSLNAKNKLFNTLEKLNLPDTSDINEKEIVKKIKSDKKSKKGKIKFVDEIHTPDSSRFWISSSYKDRINSGQEPENIDKEFLRLWFAKNCDPYNDEVLPDAPDDLVAELSARYILLYELITGEKFIFPNLNDINKRITENIKELL